MQASRQNNRGTSQNIKSAVDCPRAHFLFALLILCWTPSTVAAIHTEPFQPAFSNKQSAEEEPAPIEVRDLKVGQTISGEMKPKGNHRYRVTLKEGQYAKVTIEQQNAEFAVVATNPAGKEIAELNLGGKGSTESLWVPGDVAGDYQIRIDSTETREPTLRYRVLLEKVCDVETASSQDRAYINGHRLLFEARLLNVLKTAPARHQALEKYNEALGLWRSVGDIAQEAYTLHEIGFLYDNLKEYQKALATYDQALAAWRKAGNRQLNEASTLYNIGTLCSGIGDPAKAIDSFKEAIELRRRGNDVGGLSWALNNLAQVYVNTGEFAEALEAIKEAVEIRKALGDLPGEARSLSNLAAVYFRLGEFQTALQYSREALPLRRASGDLRGESITLFNIGTVYRELGDPKRSLEFSQQALSLLRQTPDDYVEAGILDAIGRNYYDLQDYPRALEYHNQSLLKKQTIKDIYGEAAVLSNIGNVYNRLGECQKAIEYLERSLRLSRTIGDRRGEAVTLQGAGEVYLESGDLKKALQYFEQGLALSRAIGNRNYEANLLYDIARVDHSVGRLAEARSRVESAIGLIESTRSSVASSNLRAAFLASKHDFYELDIDLLMQSYRHDRNQADLVEAFRVSEQRRARSLVESLEEARANIRQGVSPELLARERASRSKLNHLAERQIKLLSGKHSPEEAAASAKEVDASTVDYEQVLTQIRISSPLYAALTQPVPLTVKEIQEKILDPDTLILEYALGAERSYLWAVTSTSVAGFELPARTEIEARARRVYDFMTARNQFAKFEEPHERRERIARADASYVREASELSRLLLGPVAAIMKGRRLVIVTDGVLQYLSFGALPLPATSARRVHTSAYTPLITEHQVINLPSVLALAELRKQIAGRTPAPKMIAVLADPVFDENDERVKKTSDGLKAETLHATGDAQSKDDFSSNELTRSASDFGVTEKQLRFGRLAFTRLEASAITAFVSPEQTKKATDFEANLATATAPEMDQYRYVHFATHGLLNNIHPELSGVVLSLVCKDGKRTDGFLSTNEIYNLNLPAEMIVLSGCRTGLGKELKGEGILGLTRAFMYAGAPRVVVSLWDVNDESTAELMTRFYKGILGKKRLSPASALREAQISMLKSPRWRMPYFWSAFILQGEYK